jgi:NTE family protein
VKKTPKKTVSLVLGSGGAKGLAHIGVIRWLEAHDYEIRSVSGCSIGALIGGMYAAGKLDAYEEWVLGISKADILSMLDFNVGSGGLVKGEKIIEALAGMAGDLLIEDLPITYTAVAADIYDEKEVWLQKGRLFDAIRASISIPLFFTPYEVNGRILVDGGILNPVPIGPTLSDHCDLTVAVNLMGKPVYETPEHATSSLIQGDKDLVEQQAQHESGWALQETIQRYLQELQNSMASKLSEFLAPNMGFYDIANRSFDTMQGTIARIKLAANPPDVTITIPRNSCGMFEFDRANEMIPLGYEKSQQAFSEYRYNSSRNN